MLQQPECQLASLIEASPMCLLSAITTHHRSYHYRYRAAFTTSHRYGLVQRWQCEGSRKCTAAYVTMLIQICTVLFHLCLGSPTILSGFCCRSPSFHCKVVTGSERTKNAERDIVASHIYFCRHYRQLPRWISLTLVLATRARCLLRKLGSRASRPHTSPPKVAD